MKKYKQILYYENTAVKDHILSVTKDPNSDINMSDWIRDATKTKMKKEKKRK